jgi:RNA polymerase sigma factor (sigma-70 family)
MVWGRAWLRCFILTESSQKPYAWRQQGLNEHEIRPTLIRAMATPTRTHVARNRVRRVLVDQRDHLLAVVRHRSAGRLDAEDVLQTALQRALERADQVRDPARVEAWLGRLVRNLVVDELRRKREPLLAIGDVAGSAIDDEVVPDCSCVLVQANQLKPEHSQILRRVVVDGVAVTEVAAELRITPNNAMVRLHRARTALKQRLKRHCGTTTFGACADCGCGERGCCPLP